MPEPLAQPVPGDASLTADRPGVLILGMHRSGTSAATALVHRLGLATCIPADRLDDPRGNAKGHFESVSMVQVNDTLLTEMGRNWWCPPRSGAAFAEDWSRVTSDPAAARRAFDEVHPEAPYVWKDPRTVLTLPFWRRALGPRTAAVAVVRNPLDVAASLATRSKLRLTHGVALWERYNRLLLANLAGMPAILTRYDDLVDDPLTWCAVVEAFLGSCGIACSPAPAGELSEFVDASLRHHSSTRAELLGSFGSSAVVHDALDASLGPWACFEAPELPEESPFVEAELTAVGSWQRDVVPKPAPPVVSVVVVAERNEAVAAADALAPQLLAFMEAVLVVRGEGEGSELAELAEHHPALRVVTVGGSTPLGAARSAGAAAARAQILDFRVPFATPSQHWPPELRRAIGAGYAAATPAVEGAGPDAGPAFGLAFRGPFCNLEWLPKPDDSLATVPLLAGACFGVRRDAFEDCGGFDAELGAYDYDVYELSVRLWRCGQRVAVVREASVTVPAPVRELARSGELDWRRFAHDLFRLAAMHFPPERIVPLVEGLRQRPGVAEALSSVLVSDAGERRAALGAAGFPVAGGLLDFGTASGPPRPKGAAAPSAVIRRTDRQSTGRASTEPASTEPASTGRASTGRASTGRASTGRASTGRASTGRASTGRASTGRASKVRLSVIVAGPIGSGVGAELEELAAGMAPGAELLDASARAEGARLARGEVLIFVSPSAPLRLAAARQLLATVQPGGQVAACPSVRAYGRSSHPLGGLVLGRRLLDIRSSPTPPGDHPATPAGDHPATPAGDHPATPAGDHPATPAGAASPSSSSPAVGGIVPAPFLNGICTTIPRRLYEEAGGYDEALEGTGWADIELSLRLWRCGASCLVVPAAVVDLPCGWTGSPALCWDDELFGMLRVAALHLDAEDHSGVIEQVSMWRGFPAAVARVASGDVGVRRADIERRAIEPAEKVLRHLCGPDIFGEPEVFAVTDPTAGAPAPGAAGR